MKERNLEDFKNEVAAEYSYMGIPYRSWSAMLRDMQMAPASAKNTVLHDINARLSAAASRHANHVKAIALQEGKKELLEIQKWSDKYEFSFQFWGMGNNNVFVEKDGTELYSTGGHETPELAIKDALTYVNKINP